MSEMTRILKKFAEYSEKIDDQNINYGDYINLIDFMKESLISYERDSELFKIYTQLREKSLKLLNNKYQK